MKSKITLKNPIMVNNSTVTEMEYDSNEINAILFAEAEAKRKAAAGSRSVSIVPAAEFDFGLHLYLGFAAIIAVNPGYDFSDMERIHGVDLVEIMNIGRNFILRSERSEADSSDEQSEIIPELSTQAQSTLNDEG